MGNEYARFKKQFLIDAVVKSLLVFLSTSLLIIAAFLIVIGKAGLDFEIAYAILIGVAFGLLLGFGSFFAFHLNEKRLAVRLDKIFNLNEKVQTMYAFRDDGGDVTALQRADTQAILHECTLKTSHFVRGWIVFIVATVLAIALFVYGIVAVVGAEESSDGGGGQNSPVEPEPDPGEPFEPTQHHRLALLELIEYVKTSQLQEEAKADVVSELELLVDKLDTFGTDAAMKSYVIAVISRVRTIVNAVNSTYALNLALGDSTNSYVSKLNGALFSLNLDTVKSYMRSFNDLLNSDYAAYYNCKNKMIESNIDASIKNVTKSLDEAGASQAFKAAVLELCVRIGSAEEHVTSVGEINALISELDAILADPSGEAIDKVHDSLTDLRKNLVALKEHDTVAENKLAPMVEELTERLENSSLNETDALYGVLADLCDKLSEHKEHKGAPSRTEPKIKQAILTYALEGLKAIIPVEKNNEDVKDEVVSRLESIFNIKAEEEESRDFSEDEETVDPEDRPETGDDGGFGTGEMLFGSNDLVIDPEKEPGNDIDSIQVEYGKIIARYDAEITRMIESGEISEEMGQMLREYFEVLLTPKESK